MPGAVAPFTPNALLVSPQKDKPGEEAIMLPPLVDAATPAASSARSFSCPELPLYSVGQIFCVTGVLVWRAAPHFSARYRWPRRPPRVSRSRFPISAEKGGDVQAERGGVSGTGVTRRRERQTWGNGWCKP